MSDNMNRFFDNLEFIAELLDNAVKNKVPLPEGAADKVAEFNVKIQELEVKSGEIRNKYTLK